MAKQPNIERTARREFLQGAGAAAITTLTVPNLGRNLEILRAAIPGLGAEDTTAIRSEIDKRHDESVQRLLTWIKQPSIAAENRGMKEGCELMMQMLREAGFQQVQKDGHRRTAGSFCHPGCGSPENSGTLFHVRRETGRSCGMDFAAI